MTRIEKMIAFFILIVGIAGASIAANEVFSGKVYFRKANVSLDAGSSITATGGSTGNLTKAHMADRTRYKDFLWDSFVNASDGTQLTAASIPGVKTIHSVQSLEWNLTETSKASTSFRVPVDYVSGQNFICMLSLESASTDTTVGFEIYVNRDATAFDAATTSQSLLAITNETTKMHDYTLTVATDTFQANDVVTFNVWRAAGTGTGANLELYNCYLSYTADM